ncbi:sigma-70 family RNA polymerase sigma factor [Micromonospora sp. LZ34]
MDELLARRFEENRGHLRALAYRMLGLLSEADDAVQETWLRVSRSGTSGVENVDGWLTTVAARVCLNMLRSRRSRREEPLPDQVAGRADRLDPEREALLADSVGLALLVVLDQLAPAERLAFVLHDMFAVPFAEIAPIVGRTPTAARQLASRARRRVRGVVPAAAPDLTRQRAVVEAFLAASRDGDFDALLALLDPNVVARADAGPVREARGARAVAEHALVFSGHSRYAEPALVNGAVGVVVAPHGRLVTVLTFALGDRLITGIEIVADPARLRELQVAVLDQSSSPVR